jgi:hypothetical protein
LVVVAGIGDAVYEDAVRSEGGGFGGEAVAGDEDSLVVAVEEVEGIRGQVEVTRLAYVDFVEE